MMLNMFLVFVVVFLANALFIAILLVLQRLGTGLTELIVEKVWIVFGVVVFLAYLVEQTVISAGTSTAAISVFQE